MFSGGDIRHKLAQIGLKVFGILCTLPAKVKNSYNLQTLEINVL